jgi:hypothetical protein
MRKLITACLGGLFLVCAVWAQLGTFSREQRIEFTRDWKGERFEDGRPRVPDSILDRMKEVTAEEAWSVLRRSQFNQQFEGNWKQIVTEPGKQLIGRAVTAVFMPVRPDVNAVINAYGKAEGRSSAGGQNSWVIDTMKPGDVVLGGVEGVTFVPPQLAEQVVESSELTRLRDEWGHQMLREGKYTPGQIDSRWTKEMEQEFRQWAEKQKQKK